MRRAATATVCKKRASFLGTGVAGKGAEEIKGPMVPDGFEGIGQNVPKQETVPPEKKIARIYRSIRHYTEFCRACGAPDCRELWILLKVRDESRT